MLTLERPCPGVANDAYSGNPFTGHVDRHLRLHGRGSVDTKATLAACLTVLADLKMQGNGCSLDNNILICATVDEEKGPLGAQQCAQWLRGRSMCLDELLVAEPTGLVPVVGHKGVLRMAFDLTGKAAHSSTPAAGRNALVAAASLVTRFAEHNCELQVRSCDRSECVEVADALRELGTPTLTPTVASAGSGINTVPAHARVCIDYRTVPGEGNVQLLHDFFCGRNVLLMALQSVGDQLCSM